MYADHDKGHHFPDGIKIADVHFFMKQNVLFLLVCQRWNQINLWSENACHAGRGHSVRLIDAFAQADGETKAVFQPQVRAYCPEPQGCYSGKPYA